LLFAYYYLLIKLLFKAWKLVSRFSQSCSSTREVHIHGFGFEKVGGLSNVLHSTSISRMAPGLASSVGSGYCVGIVDGNHNSGIRNGGMGGTAVGGTGVCVVGGFVGGFSCLVGGGDGISIGGSGGSIGISMGGRVGVLTCV
jgi:hypothetical protein